jgi:hypothetical protein
VFKIPATVCIVNLLQSNPDIWTNPVIEMSILPITGLAIGIRYPDSDIGP